MGASFAAHPNVMSDLLLRRRTQIEIDPRIRSSRFYRDGRFDRAMFPKTHFVDTSRQRSCVMAVDISVVVTGETWAIFGSNRISATFTGRPSVPTTFPSTEEVWAESVAEKANEHAKRRVATRDCRGINQHCANLKKAQY